MKLKLRIISTHSIMKRITFGACLDRPIVLIYWYKHLRYYLRELMKCP